MYLCNDSADAHGQAGAAPGAREYHNFSQPLNTNLMLMNNTYMNKAYERSQGKLFSTIFDKCQGPKHLVPTLLMEDLRQDTN